MRRLLVIAYFFPPLGGVGGQRTLKFVRYLPEYGWQTGVVAGAPQPSRLLDESLLEEIPAGAAVRRAAARSLPPRLPWRLRHWITRWLLGGDELLGWVGPAQAAARRLLAAQNYDAIYSSSAPFASHRVALALKRSTGLPWIADFRDPWIGNFSTGFASPLHEALARRAEAQVARGADVLLGVSQPMVMSQRARYPELPPGKFRLIPNGYDPADFPPVGTPSPNPRLTIVYTGSFYGTRQSPAAFLGALRRGMESGALPPQAVQLRLVGSLGKSIAAQLTGGSLAHCVELLPFEPHRRSISRLLSADLLLLIIGSGPGSEAVLTGKLFEYLAARRPILALAPPGAAADLVRAARAGWVVDPDNESQISARLIELYGVWKAGRLHIHPDETVIQQYNRRRQAAVLAADLDELAGPP